MMLIELHNHILCIISKSSYILLTLSGYIRLGKHLSCSWSASMFYLQLWHTQPTTTTINDKNKNYS